MLGNGPFDLLRALSTDSLDCAAPEDPPAVQKLKAGGTIAGDHPALRERRNLEGRGHQISSQATVRVSVGVVPPLAEVPTVRIITRWSAFSPVEVYGPAPRVSGEPLV